ncbi:MAG: Rrf2 family transcriptional regulator [Phycisphaerae bacterium]|nr:Rrf2 family transcriptional regulator [Phycisphaerae bacterium]
MTTPAVHQLGFGKAATYAMIALIHIAEQSNGHPIQGREIASARKLPFGYLLKILQQLVRGQILASQVGRAGGFKLNRPANEISVLEVIEAVDGHLVASTSAEDRTLFSPHALGRMETVYSMMVKTMREFLGRVTIAELTSADSEPD